MADDPLEDLRGFDPKGSLGRPLRLFEAVDSTNTAALAWAAEEPPHGALVVAHHQSAGRGRWGRTWFSEPGGGLLFSLILKPTLAMDQLGLLTLASGLGCARGVASASGLPVRLKWPNDLLVEDKKTGGILIESVVNRSQLDAVVVGVGLNLRWPGELPPEIADTATSIDRECERRDTAAPQRAELLEAVLVDLERAYGSMGEPEALLDDFTSLADVDGVRMRVRGMDGSTLVGFARGLGPTGALRLEVDGRIDEIEVAEIERLRRE